MSPTAEPNLGLRERKKARTRAEIQRQALRLIRKQGYEATTISQIAEAADISESTFFRYYPSKEDVILRDDFDEPLFAAYVAQPPELDPVAAMRGALRAVFGRLDKQEREELRQRTQIMLSVPELRAAMAGATLDTMEQAAHLVATRTGRSPDDLGVRVLSGALLGAMMSVTLAAANDPEIDYVELIDRSLAEFEAGLKL